MSFGNNDACRSKCYDLAGSPVRDAVFQNTKTGNAQANCVSACEYIGADAATLARVLAAGNTTYDLQSPLGNPILGVNYTLELDTFLSENGVAPPDGFVPSATAAALSLRTQSSTSGNGGFLRLFAGNSETGTNAGFAILSAGSSTVSGDGGGAFVQAGNAVTGSGGNSIVQGGNTATGTTGGNIFLIAGNVTIDGDGGQVQIAGGSTVGDANAIPGHIKMTPGSNTNGGAVLRSGAFGIDATEAAHFVAEQPVAPGITGPGAPAPTIDATSTDTSGYIELNGGFAEVMYARPYAVTPFVVLSPGDVNSATGGGYYIDRVLSDSTLFHVVNSGGLSITLYYHVIGTRFD